MSRKAQEQRPIHTSGQRMTALLVLLGVCVAWGSTFPLMDESLPMIASHLGDGTGFLPPEPVVFLVLRFGMSVLGLLPLAILWKRQAVREGTVGATLIRDSILLGALFTGSFFLQVYGLLEATPAVSAFLTSLFVVVTPLAVFLFTRVLPARHVAIACVIALAGAMVISTQASSHGDVETSSLLGILLSIACGVGFAFHIAYTDVATRRVNPLLLSFWMLVFALVTSVLALPLVVDLREFPEQLGAIVTNWDIMWRLLIMVAFATVFAVVAWNVYQKVLGPSRAAVLYTLEPVFASLFSLAMGLDVLSVGLIAGGGLIVGANLYCELRSQLHDRKRDTELLNAELRNASELQSGEDEAGVPKAIALAQKE